MAAPALDRFLAKVNKRGDIQPHMGSRCWEWTGGKNGKGYGSFWDGERVVLAHRWAFEWYVGVPTGLVCHACDNPSCVRPGHLFLGDHLANSNDKVAKGRQARGASSRSPLTECQVVEIIERRANGEKVHDLAHEFGVSGATVSRVASGARWGHLSRNSSTARP